MEPKPTLSLEGAILVSTFYKEYRKDVFLYLMHNIKIEAYAEDVTSAVFMKVAQKIAENEYKDNNNPKSWIMTIAHNEMINHFRKSKRSSEVEHVYLSGTSQNPVEPYDLLIRFELHKDIRSLIDRLSKDQKEIIMLRIYAEMPFKEIETMMGLSNNSTLRVLYFKSIINLRRLIMEKGIDLDRYLKPG